MIKRRINVIIVIAYMLLWGANIIHPIGIIHLILGSLSIVAIFSVSMFVVGKKGKECSATKYQKKFQ